MLGILVLPTKQHGSIEEGKQIIEAVLLGLLSRIGFIILLVFLKIYHLLDTGTVLAVSTALGVGELLAHSSERWIESGLYGKRKTSVILALIRKRLSSLTFTLVLIAVGLFFIILLVLKLGLYRLSLVLGAVGISIMLWWRGSVSAVAVKLGLSRHAYRASITFPAVGFLLVLLSRGFTGFWGLLILYSSYLASTLLLAVVLAAAGIVSRRYFGRVYFGSLDLPTVFSSAKYFAGGALVLFTGSYVYLLVVVLFDLLGRVGAMLSVLSRYSPMLNFLVVIPGLVVGDIVLFLFGLVLGLLGFVGLGYQSPARCILCV
jgi:hypothetical protein